MNDLIRERRAPQWTTDLYIDGRSEAGRGDQFDVVNPATERTLAEVAEAAGDQVDAAVDAARRAFDDGPWPRMPSEQRAKYLHALADQTEAMHAELAAGVVCEVGSPVALATTLQTAVAVNVLRSYAELAGRDRTE